MPIARYADNVLVTDRIGRESRVLELTIEAEFSRAVINGVRAIEEAFPRIRWHQLIVHKDRGGYITAEGQDRADRRRPVKLFISPMPCGRNARGTVNTADVIARLGFGSSDRIYRILIAPNQRQTYRFSR